MASHQSITRQRLMIEMVGKHALIVLVFLALYRPLTLELMTAMPLGAQDSVIGFMGLLMAAAIVGAFELNYSRTNLADAAQRYLAHMTKFMLYSSILMEMDIAVKAIRPSGPALASTMVMAATPVALALVVYDFWDALRALDERAHSSNPQPTKE
jgi:hypothetical protein